LSNINGELVGTGWRLSKPLIVVEFAIIAALFAADAMGLIPFSKTLFILVVVIVSWRLQRVKWRDVGFRVYRNWPLTLALGILGGVVLEGIELFVSQPLLVHLLHKEPDLSVLAAVRGNLKLLTILIVLAWTVAAVGEEVVYRGYLMNRVADLFPPSATATAISLVIMSIIFGFAHAYQGVTGIVDEGFMGLLLGLMYLAGGRNLLIPITAHGVQDTIDVVLLYLGNYPMPKPI
jgi:membrane protease YdiL (CAAX protease family)